ncbi:MAG: DUF4380 domain-containing protein [Bdellovibrionota bacterium]
MIETKEISYDGWKAVQMGDKDLVLTLVPSLGGRIMSCRFKGQELFFQHPLLRGKVHWGESEKKKTQDAFPLWGGDKTWIAPQSKWSHQVPYPVLDSGNYDWEWEKQHSDHAQISMVSDVCQDTGLKIRRKVSMDTAEPYRWLVRHEITQVVKPKESGWGVWNVCMVKRPAKVFLPISPEVAPSCKIFDHEGESRKRFEQVVQTSGQGILVSASEDIEFKYGTKSLYPWIVSAIGEETYRLGLGKRFVVQTDHETMWPDDCSVEVYNSAKYNYFEMELLSPMQELEVGQVYAVEEECRIKEFSSQPEWEHINQWVSQWR